MALFGEHHALRILMTLTHKSYRKVSSNNTNRWVFLTTITDQDLETQLEFYRHHFPGVRELARSRGNSLASEPRANGGRDPNPNGPNLLPLPPKPIWHSLTAHNPNFVPRQCVRSLSAYEHFRLCPHSCTFTRSVNPSLPKSKRH
jgi:hypothetical protein